MCCGYNNCQSPGNVGGSYYPKKRYGNTFSLIVVLFILLIIVGAVGSAFC